MKDSKGWDGKLRVGDGPKAIITNPEALEDPDYSDEDAPPVEEIEAEEGMLLYSPRMGSNGGGGSSGGLRVWSNARNLGRLVGG